jgi:hypothetical protein
VSVHRNNLLTSQTPSAGSDIPSTKSLIFYIRNPPRGSGRNGNTFAIVGPYFSHTASPLCFNIPGDVSNRAPITVNDSAACYLIYVSHLLWLDASTSSLSRRVVLPDPNFTSPRLQLPVLSLATTMTTPRYLHLAHFLRSQLTFFPACTPTIAPHAPTSFSPPRTSSVLSPPVAHPASTTPR